VIRGSRLWPMTTVIVGAARTPIGKFNGGLASLQAVDLGGHAIAAALARASVDGDSVDEVIMGHVLQAGTGQITSRQAAVKGGIPMSVPSLTVNKVCLSALSAIGLGDRSIRLGDSSVVVAGGMESMTNAPYVVPNARWGARYGNTEMVDILQHDGLFCAFDHCTMGESSDRKNDLLGIGRAVQDEWSAMSHARAHSATESGLAAKEIAPVSVAQRRGEPKLVEHDEGVRVSSDVGSLGGLRPAFTDGGTITAGNASQISDGAAAVVMTNSENASKLGLEVVAEVVSYGQIGGSDATLHERPAQALQAAVDRAGISVSDLAAVEINEAFAAVAIHSAKMLGLSHDIVNVHGGAVALGHPIGATGARLVVTLINVLQQRGGGYGAVTLCGGGGQGDAVVIKVDS
jgi:acetyl-CoA C-acetyltransferase